MRTEWIHIQDEEEWAEFVEGVRTEGPLDSRPVDFPCLIHLIWIVRAGKYEGKAFFVYPDDAVALLRSSGAIMSGVAVNETGDPIWQTKDGKVIPLKEMTDDHLKNSMVNLERAHERRLSRIRPGDVFGVYGYLVAEALRRKLISEAEASQRLS